ncbi:MAG TPA: primosomal protein N' [Bacteroidia bacterium]|nr:primosomal protein N' [Bacteroidia bacterium]
MNNKNQFLVDVILPLPVNQHFTYLVPEELVASCSPGKRVIVPFGKSRIFAAIIRNVRESSEPVDGFKAIQSVLDEMPIVNSFQFDLWSWISEYYLCQQGEVMNAALPPGLKLQSETKVMLNPSLDSNIENFEPQEQVLIEQLLKEHEMRIEDVADLLKKKSVHLILKRMMEKGIIILSEEIEERYKPKKEIRLKFSAAYESDSALHGLFQEYEQDKKKEKQLETLMTFLKLLYQKEGKDYVRKQDLIKEETVSTSSLNTLIKNNILKEWEVRVDRMPVSTVEQQAPFELSLAQQTAIEEVKSGFVDKDVALLHGVTSSGKTELYIHLIEETIRAGKQVLYLLPEIALTTQIITRLRRHFGDRVGVYHSRYSSNERVETWNHVNKFSEQGNTSSYLKAQIVLGARSALFLPFSKLGLIIVDEEHDSSYKQNDPAPRYHGRDTAIVLAKMHHAKVILGSATPSLESYYNAQAGRYALVKLQQRYGGVHMPQIMVADVKEASRKRIMKSHFTPELIESVDLALKNKEQIILFQNRRGFSPYLECKQCNWIPNCKNCSVTLTYHKQSHQLKCHYCGYGQHVPAACLQCGDHHLEVKGFGTEKIEEEIAIFFPDARIARMDLDATRSKQSFHRIITDFEERRIDILVGTQMVTKGLDFDNVSTVGIINADQLLNYPDFRSHERSFQLMAQVSGRSGRKQKQGKVIIQTQQPNHWVIRDVVKNDYEGFYKRDLYERHKFNYPPHSRLIEIIIRHKDTHVVHEASTAFATLLRNKLGQRVIGPHIPLISRIRNLYHRVVIIKLEREISSTEAKNKIKECQVAFYANRENHAVQMHVDVDPM